MALQAVNCIKWIILNFHYFLTNEAKFIGQQPTLPGTVCLSNPHCASDTIRH